mgnify:FL=1
MNEKGRNTTTVIKELSRIGTYHALANGENQDSLCHGKSKNLYVISLADGASTCKEAKRGASIASQAITNLFLKKGNHFLEFDDKQIAEFTLSHILWELNQEASNSSQSIIDYSSTVASVLVDKRKRRMLCFNLGDSIILASGNGRCKVLCMPSDSSSGCCVTTTKWADKGASVRLCDIGSMESVVICSDGAWREMFSKNRLKPEVSRMLSNNEYDELKDFLNSRGCFDDYSFISLDIRHKNRRKCA